MTTPSYRIVSIDEVPANRRRGGEIRTLLSPGTVHSTSGFMGAAILQPGERIGEHYHPYSEEFLFLVRGELDVDLDGEPTPLRPGQGLYIPIGVRHRLRNTGMEEAFAVFQLGPLAPRPELGHVDTEAPEVTEATHAADATAAATNAAQATRATEVTESAGR